ncbi:hypothetical protein A8C56_11235 [Niabella ginsenosidivorans]|uniref:Outer membrane protein beta-barrel domain-containing protein n=1 Tax=Niabella ginsenosidivorans TaxID=1176587 RepID=A0A1A9I1E9_9BACT|nr:hypothetical protein [Niabella ginsenosidivorans]ANH81478.1 hypothetical protein A8C56_11235 [Niabella ginsenosidivorans]
MQLFFGAGLRGKVCIALVITLFTAHYGQAQTGSSFRVNIENLYSTHGNSFPGLSAAYHQGLGSKWELGAGMEYSNASTHNDNRWNLYHLYFFPFYFSEYYKCPAPGNWVPNLHLQEGLGFINYYKEFQDHPGTRYYINEHGFNGFAGIDTHYYFSVLSGVFAEAGLKGFHLSFNNLDVNPHGLTAKLGYVYRLK